MSEIPPFLDRRNAQEPIDPVAEVVALTKMRDDCDRDIQKIRKSIKKDDRKKFDDDCARALATQAKAARIAQLKAEIESFETATA